MSTMCRNFVSVVARCAVILLCASEALAESPSAAARDDWLRRPAVSVMTGFIYEPLSPYTIDQWKEDLGHRFDADQWVKGFQEAGATHLVFYDKWIDGLVFHDTKTTDFKTHRDFLRDLAAACQRAGLPLVIYFNALSDGNPEFDQWATLDKQGRPIVFSPRWPTRYQTLHSPFRAKAVEQVRELLSNYGPIHGLWHDIFNERLNTSSPWVAKGYETMYGEPFETAAGERLSEFNVRTLAGYLDEIDAIRRQQGQEACVFTSNGSGANFLRADQWAERVGTQLGYLYNEGHSFARNDELARMAWVLPKPLDINLLLNRTWFTPLDEAPPPAAYTEKQAIAATAIAVCQGAGVNWALTPGHAGTFGEDLQRARAAGAWYRQVQPWVEGAEPYADVAIVVGAPAAGGPGLPAANPFWNGRRKIGAWQDAVALGNALQKQGLFSRLLFDSAQGGNWPDSLDGYRVVLVPELAVLDEPHLDVLRRYVRGGGRLVAFGHATLLDGASQQRQDYGLSDVLGVQYVGEVDFPAERRRAAIAVDSEYSPEYGAHVLSSGQGEAWASAGTPMPHWVELTMPAPVDVAQIVLVNRPGPYQITDLAIEVHEAGKWNRVKLVQGASEREIRIPIAPPVRVEKFRVKILRHLFRGEERQYADLGAIRVLDVEGRDWVGAEQPIPLTFTDPDTARAFGELPPAWKPRAVRVQSATADVLATFDAEHSPPAVLTHAFGKGRADLITTSDGFLEPDAPFWRGFCQLVAGEPTLGIGPEDGARYRIILTRAAGKYVLHAIDSRADVPGTTGRPVPISLLSERLSDPDSARLAGSDQPLVLSKDGRRISFTIEPDPVASVIFP